MFYYFSYVLCNELLLGVEAVDTHRPKTAVSTNGGANNLAADLASPILIAQEAQVCR